MDNQTEIEQNTKIILGYALFDTAMNRYLCRSTYSSVSDWNIYITYQTARGAKAGLQRLTRLMARWPTFYPFRLSDIIIVELSVPAIQRTPV